MPRRKLKTVFCEKMFGYKICLLHSLKYLILIILYNIIYSLGNILNYKTNFNKHLTSIRTSNNLLKMSTLSCAQCTPIKHSYKHGKFQCVNQHKTFEYTHTRVKNISV